MTDIRDRREIESIALVMDHINSGSLTQAMDVLSQRIQAIQSAKAKGGSWEKASKMELLMPSGVQSAASGLLKLTQ